MTDQPSPRQPKRLKAPRALTSTTAIQTLEITTTAVVTGSATSENVASHLEPTAATPGLNDGNSYALLSEGTDNGVNPNDMHRKASVHHHYHHLKTPTLEAQSTVFSLTSPSPSPTSAGRARPVSSEIVLPPPITRSAPSEAVVALQDAADEATIASIKKSVKRASNSNFQKGASSISSSSATMNDDLSIFDSSFFSEALLIQWSNVMGPKVEKVWSNNEQDEERRRLQTLIARQVLNGEMGRKMKALVESKWIVLSHQHEAIVCTGFLFNDPTLESLCALVFVVPVRYLRNFSRYFQVLCDRIPLQLVEPLIKLRKLHHQLSIPCSTVLEFYQSQYLIPFIRTIMDLESVSLPIECVKTGQTILDNDMKDMLGSHFMAKVITSHLQTAGSTLLVGNTLTTMNQVINTLALFLTTEERCKSSHARKHHHYMPDLYLQGLLTQNIEEMNSRLEVAILESLTSTTIVDMTKSTVRRTPLYHGYDRLRAKYHKIIASKLEERLTQYAGQASSQLHLTTTYLNDWSKRVVILEKMECVAPMVQQLLEETQKIPVRMREAYIKQWRRLLVRKAVALLKFVQKETHVALQQWNDNDLIARSMNALALYDEADFRIVLSQAEKLQPGIAKFINLYSSKDI